MSDSETENRAELARHLPVLVGPRQDHTPFDRYALPASFVSQMIAARDNLGAQKLRRRSPAGYALDAYRNGGTVTQRRMPVGYRLSTAA